MSISLSTAAVLAFFSSAFAQPQAVQPPGGLPSYPLTAPATSAVDCYNNATTFGLLSQQQAYALCLGATNSAPFDCFRQATRSTIDESTALKLCRCTISTGRVDCYTQAHSSTQLSEDQILDLCTHDINSSAACTSSQGAG